MVQRYDILKRDMVKSDDGNMVLYSDYTALEQRFNTLSTKFAVLVEENATLRKQLEDVLAVGHNDNCIFCAAKDMKAIELNAEGCYDESDH